MLVIYVPQINNRIHYIFSFIFEHILGISFHLTTSSQYFLEVNTPRIAYSPKGLDKNGIHFQSSTLLFEHNIKKQNPDSFLQDLFAISFFLISRYEEYLPYKEDLHQRFSYQSSILKDKINIVEPFIDEFAYQIFNLLKEKYPNIKRGKREFTFINTIDIDHAWLYKNHTIKRTTKTILKKAIQFKIKDIIDIIRILLNKKEDPYDIYSFIKALKKPTVYFISYGKGSKLDTNHNPENKNYQNLILSLQKNKQNKIGLHPSYFSNSDIHVLEKEKENLEELINHSIYSSRQHFIKLKLPETYHNLINLGITEDYTMGFQDHIGFRAGTCTPFYWFDLTKNQTTDLKVYPFSIMDVTLKNYMRLDIEEASHLVTNLIHSVKKVEGTFIPIFHNDSLSNYGEWKNWRNVYLKILELVQK